MDKKDFFERFKGLLLVEQNRYNLDSVHDAMIVWFAENCLHLDPEDVKERLVVDSHAEAVDTLLVDSRKFELIFLQAKTVTEFEETSKAYRENDIKLTMEGMRLLLSGDYSGKITPELEDLVKEYHELDNAGGYKTRILFLAMKAPPVDRKFIDEFRKDHQTVDVDFFDFDKIQELYETEYLTIRLRPPERISFTVIENLLRKEEPFKARVFTCSAKELAKNYNDYKDRMFQANVRYFLGLRSSVDINSQIVNTSIDPELSANFWYYNNGITIVCDEIHEPTSGKIINLKNAQIINGAQTTAVLYQVLQDGKLQEDVQVLIKAIQSNEKKFVENVTLYTNSQNAIRLRDLCSNEQVQDRIKKVMMDSFGYYYEKKRGEFDSEYDTLEKKRKVFGNDYRDRLVSNENAAQAFLAFYRNEPSQAKAETARIFMKDQTGFYSKIFNDKDDNLAEKLFLAWRLLKYVEALKAQYRSEYKKAGKLDDQVQAEQIYRFDFLLHSEYFVLNLLRDFLLQRGHNPDGSREQIINIIALINNDSTELRVMYEKIKDCLMQYALLLKKQRGYYHNKFFKSEKSIGLVRNHFHHEYDFVDFL